jgi:hypothetical protein
VHFQNGLTFDKSTLIFSDVTSASVSVPTESRSFRTGPKKNLVDRSVQDLKIAKTTSKDLFFDPGTIIRFFKKVSLEF